MCIIAPIDKRDNNRVDLNLKVAWCRPRIGPPHLLPGVS